MTYSLNTLNGAGKSAPRSAAARFGHELGLVLGLLALVFWLLAMVSYSAQDAAWSTSGAGGGRPLANWVGRFGAWLADGSYFLFGFSVWWCVAAGVRAWLSSLARWMRGGEPVPGAAAHGPWLWRAMFWGGLLLLMCTSTALEWSRLYRFEALLPGHAGGMLGYVMGPLAVKWLGFAGSGLAGVVLVVLGAGVVVFELMSVVLLQRLARRETLGRVFGLVGTVSNAGKLTGALAAPAVASSLGIAHAMTASGITVALLGAMAVPGLVRLARTTRARQDQLRPITDVLAALAVFEHAPQPALERLAAAVEPVRLDAGAVAIQQGEQADDLYVIREGTCTVFDGQRQINALAAGDWFGEIGLLQHRPRTATVVVDAGGALLWRIPGTTFLDALQESASAPMALVEVMADRLARSAT